MRSRSGKIDCRARVAELADALDLGSSVFGRGGSSPPSRTSRTASCRVVTTRQEAVFVRCDGSDHDTLSGAANGLQVPWAL